MSDTTSPAVPHGTALIIGAGPAGLTAAYELMTRTGVRPIILETTSAMGGISRTVNYKGNRIDIGGHRFFSKSDRVMDWWLSILPLQKIDDPSQMVTYRGRSRTVDGLESADPDREDRVMLVRSRRSRIYFNRKFFEYPIKLSPATLRKLGLVRSTRIGLSYIRSALFPIRPERNLEEFFINRFGRELYRTFFKSYTEKVWGVPCNEISAEWGAQRIKGLSIFAAIAHNLRRLIGGGSDLAQKNTQTSLIERFLYPKFGPGQMWEEVERLLRERGAEFLMNHRLVRLLTSEDGRRIRGIIARRESDGAEVELAADYVFSTMPVRHLVRALDCPVPDDVLRVSEGLMYRDFITVGLLLKKMLVTEEDGSRIRDNWIYIQEPDVLVGRMQVFNNWSPYMVADPSTTWIGLEFFCTTGDEIWNWPDERIVSVAKEELARMKLADPADVLDAVVIRIPKTYPAYFGTYSEFEVVRRFTDTFDNLFLVGRNGMHKYNNQDHSMLTAMVAVDNILEGRLDKANLWEINTEEEFHEEK
ncbi:MAG TPA: NAD(P)/FAD-dependent oxidoreductase [Thermoanaerobaculia bacterium]|nr:NAD(P)/FAD-dependent oxidoreductase [Thermoanaerobaculia bacterium]